MPKMPPKTDPSAEVEFGWPKGYPKRRTNDPMFPKWSKNGATRPPKMMQNRRKFDAQIAAGRTSTNEAKMLQKWHENGQKNDPTIDCFAKTLIFSKPLFLLRKKVLFEVPRRSNIDKNRSKNDAKTVFEKWCKNDQQMSRNGSKMRARTTTKTLKIHHKRSLDFSCFCFFVF